MTKLIGKRVVAYLRLLSDKQDLTRQRVEIFN